MSTHLNLMKGGEFRRQGAVSGPFLVRVCIFTTLAFGLVFGALAVVQYRIARQELIAVREVWKMREPTYNMLQAMRTDLTELQKIQEELNGWASARVNWDFRFVALQRIVPDTLQIRRLNLRGDHEFLKDAKATKGSPKPGRKYVLAVEGRIVSENPVVVVNQFMDGLARAEGFQGLLAGVRMPEGLRQELTQTEIPESRFVVEATTERLEF